MLPRPISTPPERTAFSVWAKKTFQFAASDGFVPKDKADEFFNAAPEPKEEQTYPGLHKFNDAARTARDAAPQMVAQNALSTDRFVTAADKDKDKPKCPSKPCPKAKDD